MKRKKKAPIKPEDVGTGIHVPSPSGPRVVEVPLFRGLEVAKTQKITDAQLYVLGRDVYNDMKIMLRKQEFRYVKRIEPMLKLIMKEGH